MNLFGTKNTISTVENTEESAKKDMEQTIDALPLKDKEDIINLINFWLEDDGGMDDIRY
jgi:demethoxyubiquinone hydroxylase (CLK1/Coq7/Cat5 family)